MMLTPDQEKMREAAKALHQLSILPQSRAYSDADIAYLALANPAAILTLLDQVEAQGWVSAAERLPEPRQQVLMIAVGVGPHKNCTTDYYAGWRGAGSDWARWPHPYVPTHWQPLPPPPEAA